MYNRFLKKSLLFCTGLVLFAPAAYAQVDTILPELPEPIQNLANDGAQVRFLGKDNGVDGWIAIKNGQEQYFYVLPDGGFLSGVLFDEKGKAVTIDQVRRLRKQNGVLLDSLTEDTTSVEAPSKEKRYEFKTPSEQLYNDIENSNWIPIGKAGTPVFYSFIDPQCAHCHDMMLELKPRIEAGEVQVRIIPVGYREETQTQAAYLLAAPSPASILWRYLDGDKNALPAVREISKQGVQKNLSIVQSWKLDVTPLNIYRGVDGKVKIIRGKPKSLDALIKDLGSRS